MFRFLDNRAWPHSDPTLDHTIFNFVSLILFGNLPQLLGETYYKDTR